MRIIFVFGIICYADVIREFECIQWRYWSFFETEVFVIVSLYWNEERKFVQSG